MRKSAIAVAVGALALPPAAQAHITLQPDEAPAGAFKRLDVRVPNEKDNASTKKVELRLPPGFVFASYEPVRGWKVSVGKQKLAKPIKTDDGELTEQVRQITWTGGAGAIGPGQFQDFGVSVQIPEKAAGKSLTFKALQTYSDGEVVRWIGPPDAEQPAPTVKATAAEGGDHAAKEDKAASAAAGSGDDGGPSTGLVVVALALGALGLAAGGGALLQARRPQRLSDTSS